MINIIIATIKEWNIENYFKLKKRFNSGYTFYLISSKDELTFDNINKINPKYIFFPHWSWKIEEAIYTNYECIVFHETDLPFGRGGSPIQNLIVQGIYDTKISALRVEKDLDAGDIYLKEDFNLQEGSAQENFIMISGIIFNKLIPKLINNNIIPIKQKGKIVNFKRRKPEDSNINTLTNHSVVGLYDFIRMLDADGYPKAYINIKNFKINFNEVTLKNEKLIGRFEVNMNE